MSLTVVLLGKGQRQQLAISWARWARYHRRRRPASAAAAVVEVAAAAPPAADAQRGTVVVAFDAQQVPPARTGV